MILNLKKQLFEKFDGWTFDSYKYLKQRHSHNMKKYVEYLLTQKFDYYIKKNYDEALVFFMETFRNSDDRKAVNVYLKNKGIYNILKNIDDITKKDKQD